MNFNKTPLFSLELMNLSVKPINDFLVIQPEEKTETLIVQRIEDVDIIGDMKDAWDNFIDSGQVWALLIGLFVGYMFRGMTSF
jgi:hypothetical protein